MRCWTTGKMRDLRRPRAVRRWRGAHRFFTVSYRRGGQSPGSKGARPWAGRRGGPPRGRLCRRRYRPSAHVGRAGIIRASAFTLVDGGGLLGVALALMVMRGRRALLQTAAGYRARRSSARPASAFFSDRRLQGPRRGDAMGVGSFGIAAATLFGIALVLGLPIHTVSAETIAARFGSRDRRSRQPRDHRFCVAARLDGV